MRAQRTRGELEHPHLERHGAGAPAVPGAVKSPQGWEHCLAGYLDLFAA